MPYSKKRERDFLKDERKDRTVVDVVLTLFKHSFVQKSGEEGSKQ